MLRWGGGGKLTQAQLLDFMHVRVLNGIEIDDGFRDTQHIATRHKLNSIKLNVQYDVLRMHMMPLMMVYVQFYNIPPFTYLRNSLNSFALMLYESQSVNKKKKHTQHTENEAQVAAAADEDDDELMTLFACSIQLRWKAQRKFNDVRVRPCECMVLFSIGV